MTYSKKDILTSISFMLFIISFSVVFVVFFKPLYYFDIHHLKLVENTHYTYQQIKELSNLNTLSIYLLSRKTCF